MIRRVLAFTSSVLFAAVTTPSPAHSPSHATPLRNAPGKAKPMGSTEDTTSKIVPLSIEYFRETRRLKEIHYAVSNQSILPLWQDPNEIALVRRFAVSKTSGNGSPQKAAAVGHSARPVRLSSRSGTIVRARVAEDTGLKIAGLALSLVGSPYRWAGDSPAGFDCSGFTQYVYRKVGIVIPRTSYEQYSAGRFVEKSAIVPGDLIFFSTSSSGPSHVAVYVGNGLIVQALNESTGVIVSHLDTAYYQRHYVGARRISV